MIKYTVSEYVYLYCMGATTDISAATQEVKHYKISAKTQKSHHECLENT